MDRFFRGLITLIALRLDSLMPGRGSRPFTNNGCSSRIRGVEVAGQSAPRLVPVNFGRLMSQRVAIIFACWRGGDGSGNIRV